jgi:membrane protease YdiL (CAAX protease family)
VIALAAVFAAGAAVAILVRSPSPARVGAAILERLGVPTPEAPPRPRGMVVAAAVLGAMGLPAVLAIAARLGVGLWTRALLYAAYAAVVPFALERTLLHRAPAPSPKSTLRIAAALAAFALALGLTNGVHFGADAAAYAARCLSAGHTAQRLLDAETSEVTRNLAQARVEWAFFAMNVLVVPLAEERVFRDLLQRILRPAVGPARAIGLASVLFAVAHLDVYRVAVYQMVPLGIACGMAYEEGGFAAAALAHALWNLHLLV